MVNELLNARGQNPIFLCAMILNYSSAHCSSCLNSDCVGVSAQRKPPLREKNYDLATTLLVSGVVCVCYFLGGGCFVLFS